MPAHSRRKGLRIEQEVVNLLKGAGLDAERVPLSGQSGGSFSGDVRVRLRGEDFVAEVKCRATGFRQIYGWLKAAELLVIRADREAALVVVPLDTFTRLLGHPSPALDDVADRTIAQRNPDPAPDPAATQS